MKGYALVRINDDANVSIDRSYGHWLADPMDPTFVAEKSIRGFKGWKCRGEGYGKPGSYGNGCIYVSGFDSVTMLTPLLSFEPEYP